MCAVINLYYRMYDRHAGLPGEHHTRRVRLARALIDEHRRMCAECRGLEPRSNYNAKPPRKLKYFRPREGK